MADLSAFINIGANTANFAGEVSSADFNTAGNVTGDTFIGNVVGTTVSTTGNITGGSLISTVGVYASVDLVAGDRANASTTKTRIVSDTDFSYIQTGNGTAGSTGNIVFSPYSSTTQKVVIDTNTGNLTASGNLTVSGTSSNVTRRAYGLVAADVNVTLDDLSANITSSTSQLALSTTGGWQGTGWTETFTSGTPSVSQWVNLPLSSGFTSASGAMVSQGQGCRCVISDQTPSAKVYQITVVRSGTTGAQWNISIERLV